MSLLKLWWNKLPEKVQRSLGKSLLMGIDNFNAASLLSWLRNCATLGYNLKKTPQVRNALFRVIVSLYSEKNVRNGEVDLFAGIVKSFGENMNGFIIPEIVKTSFCNGIEQLSAQFDADHLTKVIYGYEHSSD
jgi:hypothetical protein